MSYADNASSGMLWLAIGTIVSKASSFVSLIVLGWYLSKEEFALYALAYSSAVIFTAIKNGGVHQILIQRGAASFDKTVNMYTRYALSVNLLAMVMIILSSSLVAKLYNLDNMYLLQLIIAISLPLNTAGLFYRSKLAIDLKFSDVAKFDAYSSIIRHGSAAIFAVLGFGVYSFLLPLLVIALFEAAYGKYKTRVVLFKNRKLTGFFIKRILNSSRWLILASLAISIALQGDYLVIGLYESKETIGLYFFGFQITIAIAVVISQGMQSVIMPLMSGMKNNMSRQADAFSRMLIVLVFLVAFLSFQMCLLSGYIIHLIWNGKWDDAIPVVQLMSLSLVTSVLVPLGKSVLEARGQWKTVSYLMVVDAIGIIISAFIGVQAGGLFAIAIAVSSYRFIYGLLYTLYVAAGLKLKYMPIIKLIVSSMVSGMVPFLLLIYMSNSDVTKFAWVKQAIGAIIFTLFYFISMLFLQTGNCKFLWKFTCDIFMNRNRV